MGVSVGLAYYRVNPALLEQLRPLIAEHESDLVGPRARGYWFDYPEEYDYERVRLVARQLDQSGQANAGERLELSEVQAHSLSMLDIEMPLDEGNFPPALFLTSLDPATLKQHLEILRRRLGSDPERAAKRFAQTSRDPRFAGYLEKQLRHLREALPLVWDFYKRAAEAEEAILVVDLRARDLETPDPVELLHAYEG